MCVLRFRLTSVVLGWWSEINVCFKVQTHISSVRLDGQKSMCVLRFRLTSVVLGRWSEVNVSFKVQTHISGVRLMVRSQCVF
jgi:hypothetical protein